MDIIKYLERVTVIFNPDGTVRGSEAHEHTGYLEERDVPDAPGAKQLVFVVVKPEVRAIASGDLAGALDGGCPAIEDAASKAAVVLHLQTMLEETGDALVAAEQLAEMRAETIDEQAAKIAAQADALAEAAKREGEMRDALQRATREADALAAELAAFREAAADAA